MCFSLLQKCLCGLFPGLFELYAYCFNLRKSFKLIGVKSAQVSITNIFWVYRGVSAWAKTRFLVYIDPSDLLMTSVKGPLNLDYKLTGNKSEPGNQTNAVMASSLQPPQRFRGNKDRLEIRAASDTASPECIGKARPQASFLFLEKHLK